MSHDLTRAAERWSDQHGLVTAGARYNYAELAARADGVARGLHEAGVRRGDRVALFLENGLPFVVSLYGALQAGAAFIPINPTTKAEKLAYVLRHSGARALIAESALFDVVDDAATAAPELAAFFWNGDYYPSPKATAASFSLTEAQHLAHGNLDPRLTDEDLAAIIYTSGSTGEPKGVTLLHRNMTHASEAISTYLGLRQGDVILDVLPLSFDYGLYQLLMSVLTGSTLVLEKGFTLAGQVLQRMRDEDVTVLPGVPTVYSLLLRTRSFNDEVLPALRMMTNTGAALHVPTIEALRQRFPKSQVFSMYGLTECKRVSYLPPEEIDRKPASVGVPIPGTQAYVVDDNGNPLPPGATGELVVRGPHVMLGYWNDAATTAEKIKPGRFPWERVLYTGDLFRQDEDGYLYFVARKDDLIKCRGERIAPKEIEEVLLRLAGVAQAAVIGVPDPVLGNALHAHLELNVGAKLTPQDVLTHCRKHLEDFRVPQVVEFVSALPRSANGKIDRKALMAEQAMAAR